MNYILESLHNNTNIIVVKNNGNLVFDDEMMVVDSEINKLNIFPDNYKSGYFKILQSTYDKINYVFAMMKYLKNEDIILLKNRISTLLKKYMGDVDVIYHQKVVKKFKDRDGNVVPTEDVFYSYSLKKHFYFSCINDIVFLDESEETKLEDNYGNISYISFLNFQNFLKEENTSYEDFISNTKYCVVIDEMNKFENFKKKGLIDISKIKKEYKLEYK